MLLVRRRADRGDDDDNGINHRSAQTQTNSDLIMLNTNARPTRTFKTHRHTLALAKQTIGRTMVLRKNDMKCGYSSVMSVFLLLCRSPDV